MKGDWMFSTFKNNLEEKRYDEKDIEMIMKVMENSQISTSSSINSLTSQFENAFSKKIGIGYALAVNSGTAALHLALLSCGIKSGDEVLVDPLYRFGAVVTLYCNATPIFYDVDINSYMPTPENLYHCITSRTKAVIITNIFGCTVDISSIRKMCRRLDIFLIEDCAHSLFCKVDDKMAGTYGDIGIFSFQSKKHLSLGEGGMLITNNAELYNNARILHNLGISKNIDNKYGAILNYGRMYRIPELVSAVGLAQLSKIDSILEYHKKIGELLNNLINSKLLKPQKAEYSDHVYWWWVCRVESVELYNYLREILKDNKLVQFGLNSQKTVDSYELFNEYAKQLHPNADNIVKTILCIKVYFGKASVEYEQVAKTLMQHVKY